MEDLIAEIKVVLHEIAKNADALSKLSESTFGPFIGLSASEIDAEVDKRFAEVPDETRAVAASMLLAGLLQAKQEMNETRRRISKRVQPEDTEREKPEFQSFVKRKGDWSW